MSTALDSVHWEAVVFSFRPNQTRCTPSSDSRRSRVIIVIEQRHPDATALGNEIQSTPQALDTILASARDMAETFNAQLFERRA